MISRVCFLEEQFKPFGWETAMAMLNCSEVISLVVDEAVQIHGGYGLMKEYNAVLFFRDYKLLTIGEAA